MEIIKKLLSKLLLSWTPSYSHRIAIVMGVLLLYVCFIFRQTIQTIGPEHEHYQKLIDKLRKNSEPITQLRGFIFSESGEMIAASLPQYDVYLDFRQKDELYYKTVEDPETGKKKTIRVKLLPKDTIDYYFGDNGPAALYLHRLAPHKTAAQHAQGVRRAYQTDTTGRYLLLRSVSYLDYKEMCQSAPYFSKNRNHIGLFAEERPHRQRPFGEHRMASSTIGGVFATDTFRIIDGERVNLKGHGRNGLEQTFDSLLAGIPGEGFIQKVRSKRTVVVEREAVDGADVYTTIDMEMQTVLDYELNKRILELGAVGGWAAVMETKTGKIKAISNLRRYRDYCQEDYNHFVKDRYDPGSTFKTVSYMILLDDGKITPGKMVDTGNTEEHPSNWMYKGKAIRDDHPVGVVSANKAMEQSSNIALAKLTTQAYESNPQRYLDLIDQTHIFDDMHLSDEFQGALIPKHRRVGDESWSPMSLAQISYGYETAIPGMYMLNFYNAIANDGKLMRPYIVSRVVKDGEVLMEREPEVINHSICKKETLADVRRALRCVVDSGTAETKWNSSGVIIREGAKSRKLQIAGKTGTAQRYDEHLRGYSTAEHYVSFAGYFPAEDPQYTCIVVIHTRRGGNHGRPGGGYMAGPVFRNFDEQIYARHCFRSLDEISPDSANVARYGIYPQVKRGSMAPTENVVGELDLTRHHEELDIHHVDLTNTTPGIVPNVVGMGASDALFMLERTGLNVVIEGVGKVRSQSLTAGSRCNQGQTIVINLQRQ